MKYLSFRVYQAKERAETSCCWELQRFSALKKVLLWTCLAVWDSQAKILGKVRICFNESRAVILLNQACSKVSPGFFGPALQGVLTWTTCTHQDSCSSGMQNNGGYPWFSYINDISGWWSVIWLQPSNSNSHWKLQGSNRVLRHAKTGDCKIGLGMEHTISHQKTWSFKVLVPCAWWFSMRFPPSMALILGMFAFLLDRIILESSEDLQWNNFHICHICRDSLPINLS